jgi:hypothetical protein
MEIIPGGAEFLHADREKDGRTEWRDKINSLFSALWKRLMNGF